MNSLHLPHGVPGQIRFSSALAILSLFGLALGMTLGCSASTAKTAPTITGFSPTYGPVGTTVTVTGTGFSNSVSAVTLGSVTVPGSTGTISSDTQLSFPVPNAAETGAIAVTNPGGTATSGTDFIVSPEISSWSTRTGSASSETQVTVAGSGLMGITLITFKDSTTAVNATMTTQTANEIVFSVPATAPVGTDTVTFQINPDYNLANLLSTFTVTS
jgi:hypothetical protein